MTEKEREEQKRWQAMSPEQRWENFQAMINFSEKISPEAQARNRPRLPHPNQLPHPIAKD